MTRTLTHLCPAHSSRQTHPRECADCEREKRLAIHDRRIHDLETQAERLESRLDALETTDTRLEA